MSKKIIILCALAIFPAGLFAQFDGIAGSEGCKAVHCDDSRIIEWATGCKVIRGYQDIARPELGYASYGTETEAIGKVNAHTEAVSLGDSGIAILTFQTPVSNGEGYDFAVFENSFNDSFLELAFVEVSSDGIHYFRFPATSNTLVNEQVGSYGQVNATLINNLAGKYRFGWGTPFDLEELPDDEYLDKSNIRYVKIIDVVGTINPDHATRDASGNIVNDPYPTAFASGGFDLTGAGVMNNQNNTSIKEYDAVLSVSVYPNPCSDFVYIHARDCLLSIYNSLGQKLKEQHLRENHVQIAVNNYPKGIYFIHLQNNQTIKHFKLIKQ
jgi:hypothetical protein